MCYKRQFCRQKCTDEALHACGSDSAKRNQCHCQQLYREVEQCKRGDRLSVGRGFGLFLCQLRTRLSEFERRNHNQLPRDRVKCKHDLLLPITSLQWVCYKRQFQRQKCKDAALTRPTAEGKAKDRAASSPRRCLANPKRRPRSVRTTLRALPCSALDFIQRRRAFQRGGIAEFFAEIRGTHNAPHHFGVSGFWDVPYENHFTGRERFAQIACDI